MQINYSFLLFLFIEEKIFLSSEMSASQMLCRNQIRYVDCQFAEIGMMFEKSEKNIFC